MQINNLSSCQNVRQQVQSSQNFQGRAVTNKGVVYEEKNYGKVLGPIATVGYTLYKTRGLFRVMFSRLMLGTTAKTLGLTALMGLGAGVLVDAAINAIRARNANKAAGR